MDERYRCYREADLATIMEQMKVANRRITDLEKTQEELREMNGNIKLLIHQLKDVTKIALVNQNEIRELKERPQKELTAYKLAVVTALIGTIVGALVGRWLQ